MLPNLAATFSSLASSVFSDFGLAGHSCLFDASSFLGFSAIFHWFSSSQLLFSACFSCSSSFFWSVSMENCTALPEGLLSFSLCFLLSWSHAPPSKAVYKLWLLTLFSVSASPVSSIVRELLETYPWSTTGTSASAFRTVFPLTFFSSTNDTLSAQLLKPEAHSSFFSSLLPDPV